MAKKSQYMPKPGYRASPLQQLSSKRNWDLLQIKGSCGQLRAQVLQGAIHGHLMSYWLGQINGLEEALTTAVNKKWAADKVAFEMSVAKEAFAEPASKVPMSFVEEQQALTEMAKNITGIPPQEDLAELAKDLTQGQVYPSAAFVETPPTAEVEAKVKAKRKAITKAAEDF